MSDELCPVAEAAKLLGDKWTLIVLRDLAQGPTRFTELGRTCQGISPSVLSARLHDLEVQQMVCRTSYPEIPPRVEYELTPKGRDALVIVDALRAYGTKWLVSASPVVALS